MSRQAKVSVLIPAYNMAEYLGAAIESVLSGNYEDIEVICVNDGSTDATERVVHRYTDPQSDYYDKRVRYFSQPNRGKSVAVNLGIEQMRGEYFALLDADDRFPPQSLSRRVEALSSLDADMAIGGFEVINKTGQTPVGGRSCPTLQNPRDLKRAFCLSYKTPFHLNACLLRRNIIERVGTFDHQLSRCQDIDYSIRCMETVQEVALVDAPVYQYRKHRDSIRDRVETRIATMRNRPRVIMKNFTSPKRYTYAAITSTFDIAKLLYEILFYYRG